MIVVWKHQCILSSLALLPILHLISTIAIPSFGAPFSSGHSTTLHACSIHRPCACTHSLFLPLRLRDFELDDILLDLQICWSAGFFNWNLNGFFIQSGCLLRFTGQMNRWTCWLRKWNFLLLCKIWQNDTHECITTDVKILLFAVPCSNLSRYLGSIHLITIFLQSSEWNFHPRFINVYLHPLQSAVGPHWTTTSFNTSNARYL